MVRALDQEADRETLRRHGPRSRDHHLPAAAWRHSRYPRPEARGPDHARATGCWPTGTRVPGRGGRQIPGPRDAARGKSVLTITVEDSLGRRKVIERELEVRSKRLFLVGLADGCGGPHAGRVFVGADGRPETWTQGRVAYQLKGWIAGRYLVTLGARYQAARLRHPVPRSRRRRPRPAAVQPRPRPALPGVRRRQRGVALAASVAADSSSPSMARPCTPRWAICRSPSTKSSWRRSIARSTAGQLRLGAGSGRNASDVAGGVRGPGAERPRDRTRSARPEARSTI